MLKILHGSEHPLSHGRKHTLQRVLLYSPQTNESHALSSKAAHDAFRLILEHHGGYLEYHGVS